MRVKFEYCIEECKKIELCRNGINHTNVLRVTTFDDRIGYIDCIDEQEAEDLYNEAYVEGYINVFNRFCDWR